jgi:hypothetical protein
LRVRGIPVIVEDSVATFEDWGGFLPYWRIVSLLLRVGGIPAILEDSLATFDGWRGFQ